MACDMVGIIKSVKERNYSSKTKSHHSFIKIYLDDSHLHTHSITIFNDSPVFNSSYQIGDIVFFKNLNLNTRPSIYNASSDSIKSYLLSSSDSSMQLISSLSSSLSPATSYQPHLPLDNDLKIKVERLLHDQKNNPFFKSFRQHLSLSNFNHATTNSTSTLKLQAFGRLGNGLRNNEHCHIAILLNEDGDRKYYIPGIQKMCELLHMGHVLGFADAHLLTNLLSEKTMHRLKQRWDLLAHTLCDYKIRQSVDMTEEDNYYEIISIDF